MEFTIGIAVGILVMLAVVALALFRHRLRASGSEQPIRCALGFHRMSHNRLFHPTMGRCRRPGCGYKYDKNPPEVQAMVRRTGREFGW
jgi:hypothetical protein